MTNTPRQPSSQTLFATLWYGREMNQQHDPDLPGQIVDARAAEEGLTLTPAQRAVSIERLEARWLLDDVMSHMPGLVPPSGAYSIATRLAWDRRS